MAYECRVQEPWFSHVRSGAKAVEGRLCKGVFARIAPGDTLLVNSAENPMDCFQMVVKGVTRYQSFREALEKEGLARVLPGTQSIEEGVAVYRAFYSEAMEASHGVVAVELGS